MPVRCRSIAPSGRTQEGAADRCSAPVRLSAVLFQKVSTPLITGAEVTHPTGYRSHLYRGNGMRYRAVVGVVPKTTDVHGRTRAHAARGFATWGQVDAAQHNSCAAPVQDETLTLYRVDADGAPAGAATAATIAGTARPFAQRRFLTPSILDFCRPAALLPITTVARPVFMRVFVSASKLFRHTFS
jgi:hypothetical protein